jgi:aminomethyltransferase
LHQDHVRLGARMVDFAGWDMPLHYGSQLDEHRLVRESVGMFDVSHMQVTDVTGAGGRDFLRRLLANDVARLACGQALYSCMLREDGGVIDDLIVYRLNDDDEYRVITNAGTREKDIAWMRAVAAGFDTVLNVRGDVALVAVQGPLARDRVHGVLGSEVASIAGALKPFYGAQAGKLFVARTGYTGEDGYEIMLPADDAPAFWRRLHEAGVAPVGLGARDTLRLEAGMSLYGQEMDETVNPLEAGLGWTVAWEPEDRDFIGRAALERVRPGTTRTSKGLVLLDKGVLRPHQKVMLGDREIGELTSGSFSPVLGRAIGLARIDKDIGGDCTVDVRGRLLAARIVTPPFVRHGRVRVTLD